MEPPTGDAFAQLLEAAPDAMVIVDQRGVIVLVNAQAERLFAQPRAKMLGKPIEMLLPERFRGAHTGHRGRFFADAHPRPMGQGLDLWALRSDGSEIPVEISLSPLRTPQGTLVTAAIRDVTARRKADAKFRALLDSAPDAMVIVDARGRIVLANAMVERVFGHARESLVGQPVEVLIPERFRARHGGHRDGFFGAPRSRPMGAGLDLYGLRASGEEFPVEISLAPLETEDGTLVTAAIRDVTERRRVQDANARLAAIVESSVDGIVGKDLDGRITSWNPGAERLFGYSAREILGESIMRIVPPELHAEERDILARVGRGEPVRDFETVRVRKDGQRVPISVTVTPLRDAMGRIIGVASIKHDITQRRLAERALRAQSLARPLVVRIMGALLERVDTPGPVVAQIGRDLAREVEATSADGFAQAFTTLGLGSLALEKVEGETYTFAGDDLLGRVPRATQPTCHLARGFLEGAVGALHGTNGLGAEVRCQSQGHEACRFVVKPR